MIPHIRGFRHYFSIQSQHVPTLLSVIIFQWNLENSNKDVISVKIHGGIFMCLFSLYFIHISYAAIHSTNSRFENVFLARRHVDLPSSVVLCVYYSIKLLVALKACCYCYYTTTANNTNSIAKCCKQITNFIVYKRRKWNNRRKQHNTKYSGESIIRRIKWWAKWRR